MYMTKIEQRRMWYKIFIFYEKQVSKTWSAFDKHENNTANKLNVMFIMWLYSLVKTQQVVLLKIDFLYVNYFNEADFQKSNWEIGIDIYTLFVLCIK